MQSKSDEEKVRPNKTTAMDKPYAHLSKERLDEEYTECISVVGDLATDTVLQQPMPLVLSFSLLSFEEAMLAFDQMSQKWPIASPEQDSLLFLLTESVVLSFSNPMAMCGMFGNSHVNSFGYSKFKNLAQQLQDQWAMTFRTHLNACYAESKLEKAKQRAFSMEAIWKLLVDLDERSGSKVKAINLKALGKIAHKYTVEMFEMLLEKKEEIRKAKYAKLKGVENMNQPQRTSVASGSAKNNFMDHEKTPKLYDSKPAAVPPMQQAPKKRVDVSPLKPSNIQDDIKYVGEEKTVTAKKALTSSGFGTVEKPSSGSAANTNIKRKGVCGCKNCKIFASASLKSKSTQSVPKPKTESGTDMRMDKQKKEEGLGSSASKAQIPVKRRRYQASDSSDTVSSRYSTTSNYDSSSASDSIILLDSSDSDSSFY